jgi:fructose-bisphosphate aldolase class II
MSLQVLPPLRQKKIAHMTTRKLSAIRGQVDGRERLVLRRTNGVQPELMKQCIAAGVTKININRLVLDDYVHLRSEVNMISYTAVVEQGVGKVMDLTREWMEICGSAGKA